MARILRRIHEQLAPRRFLLLAICAAVVCACAVLVSRIQLREDIRAMLPESGELATDFEMLRLSPFTRRLAITVGHPGASPVPAARIMAEALQKEGIFTQVMTGPPAPTSISFLNTLLDALPALFTAEDEQRLNDLVSADRIRAALAQDRRTLIGPGGIALKSIIARDPLGLRNLALAKLVGLSRLAEARVENSQFVSKDGLHALILAETDIPMTDSRGAARVMEAFQRARQELPAGAEAILVGGHRHTLANAEAVKADLKILLPASLALLAIILLAFMPTLQSLYVLLIPACVIVVAGAATAAVSESVSGIVLGFGAVLLGISVDYALHVFFALRQPAAAAGQPPAAVLADVSRPVTFGALTSLAVFAALLISDIPGIRQLALFSIFGLLCSLLLSLFVLPHFIGPARRAASPNEVRAPAAPTPERPAALAVAWAAVLAMGLWAGGHLRLSGDLRELSYTPRDIRADEQTTRDVWGGFRETAMIFADGKTLDEVLAGNDRVWDYLRAAGAADGAVSLSPLLPGPRAQETAMARWEEFWQANASGTLERLDGIRRDFGFSAAAFSPFARDLKRKPEPVSVSTLESLGLGGLMDMLLVDDGNRLAAMTLVPDSPGLSALLPPETEAGLGVRLISGGRFREILGRVMGRDVLGFSAAALGAVSLLTWLLFRDLRRTLLALLPVGAGVSAVAGIMAATAQPLNLFHIVSFPLIMGLGSDYGIFMVCRAQTSFRHGTRKAVLFSGLTTVAGFGVLILARHPALHSIGVTVLTGIAASMGTALLIVPRLQGGRP